MTVTGMIMITGHQITGIGSKTIAGRTRMLIMEIPDILTIDTRKEIIGTENIRVITGMITAEEMKYMEDMGQITGTNTEAGMKIITGTQITEIQNGIIKGTIGTG